MYVVIARGMRYKYIIICNDKTKKRFAGRLFAKISQS